MPVVQVEDYIETYFKYEGLRWDIYDIYIGRSDTKYVDYVISAKANDTIYFDGEIFSKNDIGKQVKLWISTTPPLGTTTGLKSVSSNCHLYREVA